MADPMSIDACDAARTRLLTWYALAFAVWAGALAAMMVLVVGPSVGTAPTPMPALPAPVLLGLVAVQLVGFLVWSTYLVRLMLLGRRVRRDPALREAARDERSRENQGRAVLIGFWVTIIAVGAAIPLEIVLGVTLTASTLASVVVWLGPTAVLLTFVASERRDAA